MTCTFKNAGIKFLNPLIKFAAILSPHPRISVPLRYSVCPLTINGTPLLYEIAVNIHQCVYIRRCMDQIYRLPSNIGVSTAVTS